MPEDKSLVRNAADAGQVKEARKSERFKRKEELADLCVVLSTPAGRRFVWKLLERAGVYRSSFSESAVQSAFAEGRRDIGLRLIADLTAADPAALLDMMKIGMPKKEEPEEEEKDGE